MKKKGKYWAAFLKRTLAMMLAIVFLIGDVSVVSAAALSEEEGTVPSEASTFAENQTEEPTAEVTAELTDGSAAEDPSAQEPTEPPAQEPTESPAQEPTEPPAQEPTEPPTQEPTEPPAQEPTEPPTQEPEEELPEPEEEPTEEWSEMLGAAESGSTQIGFDGYLTADLTIFNYLHFTNANDDVAASSGSYTISGTNTKSGILIGDCPLADDPNTQPLANDIPVSLNGLDMTGEMTINPVGQGNNKVVLTVLGASELGALTLAENARLELVLNAGLTVGSITLGKNSSLTVTGSGLLHTVGGFSGSGAAAVNGAAIRADGGIAVGGLSLSNTTINANACALTATDTLSMADSTVENCALFGYAAETGERTLALSGNNTFTAVSAVGCEPSSNAIISVELSGTVSDDGGTSYYRDYAITYLSESEIVAPRSEWPTAYRVSSGTADFSGAVIRGYHTEAAFKEGGSVPLPLGLVQAGYEHQGWKQDGSEEIIPEITQAEGDIRLSAVLTAGAVTVKLDRDYDPDRYTNDADADGNIPERPIKIESQLDQTVSLPTPTRFGYRFAGWEVTSGTEPRVIFNADGAEAPYQIKLADCVIEEEKSVVNMKAKWEADAFQLILFLGGTEINDEYLMISIDDGESFQKFRELKVNPADPAEGSADAQTGATPKTDFNIEGHSITFSEKWKIQYGENISSYLHRVFKEMPEGKLPILRDDTPGGAAKSFAGWTSEAGPIDGTALFAYGENGILTPGDKTLTEYQANLHAQNATISAVWGIMSYSLTLPETMPTGWSLSYTGADGAEHSIQAGETTNGHITVQQDSTVTLTTSSVSSENFSLWSFKTNSDKIQPTELTFHSGDPYLHYAFTMPAANVTATYGKGKDIWIDIAKSPIEFEENVTYNGIKRNGFWYADLIDEMTPLFQSETKLLSGTDINGNELTTMAYFYQWVFSDKFCVTSEGVETRNQLTLVNALSGGVYLKDVKLTMRDAYVSNTNGSLLAGVDCESSQDDNAISSQNVENSLKGVNLADYANIVIDISKHSSYTTTLHFVGKNNTVGAIMHNALQISNISPLELKGDGRDSSTVKLGTAFGYFRYTISDITVTEYTKENNDFKYLIYGANQSGFQVTNAVIDAPNKNVHAGYLMKTEEVASFQSSEVELYSICVFQGVSVINSYLRVHENARFGRIPIYLAESSKVVIDGNMEMNLHHMTDSGDLTDKTNNWLIVKGNICDISNHSWQSGTLICNNLVLGRTGGVKGGTVITNQITSQPVGFWNYDKDTHTYNYNPFNSNRAVKADQNNDDYPFLVYNQNAEEPNTHTFSGGKIYLLGYYKVNGKTYDSTVKATDDGNPVADFMKPLLDNNTGDLVSNPNVDITAVQKAVIDSSLKTNECVVLGNSNEFFSQRRSVAISGGEIYAAGNITFYNDTTVSGGTIFCNGSFGSKGDLTVTGGSITATAVGNAYNLKTTMEDGTLRWKRTDIRGGTVTAERIGAFAKRVSDTGTPDEANQPKSTVTIGTGDAIVGSPKICHDVYINYIFDTKLFSNDGTPKNGNTLRFETTWDASNPFAEQVWKNTALSFTAPNVLAGGGSGSWNWDSLTGSPVDAVSAAGIAQNNSAALTEKQKAYDRIQMKLYAVKDSYDLIFKAGADEITAITCNGAAVTKTDTNGQITASAKTGGNVVLTFANSTMAGDYSVLWYIDGSGIIHSVNPTVSENRIRFTMPNSDVEVYVTKDMALDLDTASYTLLENGFRTEAKATPERTDSTFRYLGNLEIHQGCITEDIEFKIESGFGTKQMKEPAVGEETTNTILVDKDFDNTASGSRTVTLTRIYQNGTTTSHGIDLEDGAKARFLLDGAIRICRVRVPEGSDFTLKGKNDDRTKDAIYPIVYGRPETHDWASIGNFDGKAGNITLQDLTILGERYGLNGSLGYSKEESNNTVQYINCVYKTETNGQGIYGWHDRGFLARCAQNVIFDKCEFTFRVSRDWPGYFLDASDYVKICNGSKITVTHNGANSYPASVFYAKIDKGLEIVDSTLDLSLRVPDGDGSETDGKTYRVSLRAKQIPPIELKGDATLVLEQHARLNKLVIGGSSTVKVGQKGDGYLLCQDIQVKNSAKLEAGGIVVSGFYDAKLSPAELETENDFQRAMAAGQYIHDGKDCPGLEVTGGTVKAKEYITGDVNGKITVKGGTVSAPKIGTTGKLYGYTRYVPKAGEKYIYTYERIPVGMDISITGGTVNVSDYLGGMKAAVSIGGGEVKLGENAVLGLTQEQQTTLTNDATAHGQKPANFGSLTMTGGKVEGELSADGNSGGSISLPYGTANISGPTTGIKVYDMKAYCGDITITGVTGQYYDNLYTGTDKLQNHDRLGISIAHQMSAKNLTVTGGSVVYANMAYANVPKGETGHITVTVDGEDRAYLYTTEARGVIGEGEGSYTYNDGTGADGSDKNVFGTKVVAVQYIIQPQNVLLEDDVEKVSNPNQEKFPYYTVTSSLPNYVLEPATCSGYEFLGWYEYDRATKTLGDKVESVNRSNSQDVYLGAKWKKVEVEFKIQIEVDASEYNPDTMTLIETRPSGKNLYEFIDHATIPYGDLILSESGIRLTRYTTKTQGIRAISYNGTPIENDKPGEFVPNTRVTAEMADAFVSSGAPLILMVPDNSLTTLNALISLDMNKTDKRPAGTKFNLQGRTATGDDASEQVSAYGSITGILGDIKAYANSKQTDGLIRPTAPGYTFGGWYTDKLCSDDKKVTDETTVQSLHNAGTTTLYAKWTPNTYQIKFCAATDAKETNIKDKRWVTVKETVPAPGDEVKSAINYHWIYDTAPNAAGDSFWVMEENGSLVLQKELPYAWREGYVFEDWQLTDANGTHIVQNQNELSTALAKNLDVNNFVESDSFDGSVPALTLYAKYRPVEVSYELNGGNWKSGTTPSASPAYGDALPGYCKKDSINGTGITAGTDYTELGTAFGADDTTEYCVVSTTSGYFKDHFTDDVSGYVPGDYRESLSRKGYTFQGWKNAEDAADTNFYGCTPRFEDISLKAEWAANTYDLTLHVKDGTYGTYVSKFSSPSPDTVQISGVTVDDPITGELPNKATWYAYNEGSEASNAEKQRRLLGVTFAALDPGNSDPNKADPVYIGYAKAVTRMINSGTLFDENKKFFLPEDDAYETDLTDAVVAKAAMSSVPDYPTGSMIHMYGVYRERSLVFIEKYVDENGITQSKVMYTHPWNVYTDYPYEAYKTDSEGHYAYLTSHAYALPGWYVRSDMINPALEYPRNITQDEFRVKAEQWRYDAVNEYDINVYTAYVGQQTIEQTLTASADPTTDTLPASYTLPGSMQEGKLSYKLENQSGLNLVTKDEMLEHLYDSTWTENFKTYTANNTVAIELVLEKTTASGTAFDPVNLSDGQELADGQLIGKDWTITLKLYHSKVMTQAQDYTFKITYSFEKGSPNVLKDQWLKDEVTVKLTPSHYTVEYRAELPEPAEKLTVRDKKGFEKVTDENVYTSTADETDYGSALLGAADTLTLEGYEREANWSYTDTNGTVSKLTALMLNDVAGKADELKDGTITVSAEYTAVKYKLTKDDSVQAGTWDIRYSDGAGDTGAPTALGESEQVKYHSVVTFTPIGDQHAEYITLSYTDSQGKAQRVRLDTCSKSPDGSSYTFVMPAYDVTISYSDVMDLYLDKGTIDLNPNGFWQEGVHEPRVTWPGNYRIWQNEDNISIVGTPNVLKISGDMADREIKLGNLNITSNNSIELASGCTAALTQTDNIQARNILVPENASLTVEGAYNKAKPEESKSITLRPENDRAAIGATAGDPVNGSITLNNTELAMTLSAPSVSSGVGPGKQNGSADFGAVTIRGSKIAVTESSNASTQYTGAWVGGAGVQSVTILDTAIENDSTNHGAKTVDGKTVTLTRCQIGSEGDPVKEPIHAANVLTITDCGIIQSNESDLGDGAMIGTDVGTTSITNSTVEIDYISGGRSDKLFTGQLLLEDTVSDVKINGTQLIELGHGSVVINEKSIEQGSASHSSDTLSLNYLLLEEKTTTAEPSITVETLGKGKTISVQEPMNAAKNKTVTIGKLEVKDEAKLVLDSDLIVTDTASIAGGEKLGVEGKDHGVVYQKGLTGEGSYSQNGGSLDGEADVVIKGDMSLTDVTANCGSHKIGSNGGSAAAATTVTINGGSVTAATVGACGAHNDTFTFVKQENAPTIEGNLVQDHYRLRYEVDGLGVDVSDLPTVLRTETDDTTGTVTVRDAIPNKPQGADTANFNCWYIWSPDGRDRYGLLEESAEKPGGLKEKVRLAQNTESDGMSPAAADGTRTLSVYAWLNASGTTAIAKGRLFKDIGAANTTEISDRGAWTAMLKSNATFITGRDYQAKFTQALPAGTDLTLTVLSSDGQKAYYHYTLGTAKDSVKFSDFTKMGETARPTLSDSGSSETFLLGADFGERKAGTLIGGNVSFSVVDGTDEIPLGGDVSYTVTAIVNGKIKATADTVTVLTPPSGDERWSGKTVYLVGTLNRTGETELMVPLNTSASLTAGAPIPGQWLSGDTVAFALGSYGSLDADTDYPFAFEALPDGEYSINWRLCADEAPNMLSGTCSNEETSGISVDPKIAPSLEITYAADSRVLAKGEAHRLSFAYKTNVSNFTVAVEKQTVLASFHAVTTAQNVTPDATGSGTVSAEIPAADGTYRVCFSIADGRADNVYYTFIVE